MSPAIPNKPDYTALDEAIVNAIKGGDRKASQLAAVGLIQRLCEPFTTRDSPTFRIIDRRLQALRKAGVIYFVLIEGWKLSTKPQRGKA